MTITVNWQLPVTHRNYNRMPASVWIRCLQLIPYLEERGIRSLINAPHQDAKLHVFVRQHDQVAHELAQSLKKRGDRIILDLVVNYFDSANVADLGQMVTPQHVENIHKMVALADAVVCASANIACRARQVHPSVYYIPDSIDQRHFRYVKPETDFHRPTLRAIWSGAPNKVVELAPILPLLRRHGFPLTIITSKRHLPEYLRHLVRDWRLPYRFLLWDYLSFPRQILQGELCVAYRPTDNTYNQGHSFFKIGVFMSQGIPAIVSPVPSYDEVIRPGLNGWVCRANTLDEWEEKIAEAARNREQLARWSHQARLALEPYTTERIAEQYVELFHSIV